MILMPPICLVFDRALSGIEWRASKNLFQIFLSFKLIMLSKLISESNFFKIYIHF